MRPSKRLAVMEKELQDLREQSSSRLRHLQEKSDSRFEKFRGESEKKINDLEEECRRMREKVERLQRERSPAQEQSEQSSHRVITVTVVPERPTYEVAERERQSTSGGLLRGCNNSPNTPPSSRESSLQRQEDLPKIALKKLSMMRGTDLKDFVRGKVHIDGLSTSEASNELDRREKEIRTRDPGLQAEIAGTVRRGPSARPTKEKSGPVTVSRFGAEDIRYKPAVESREKPSSKNREKESRRKEGKDRSSRREKESRHKKDDRGRKR